jgi:hypothetical protein
MPEQVDPVPQYEAYEILPQPMGEDRLMLTLETRQGPVLVHMRREVLQRFFELSKTALLLLPRTTLP